MHLVIIPYHIFNKQPRDYTIHRQSHKSLKQKKDNVEHNNNKQINSENKSIIFEKCKSNSKSKSYAKEIKSNQYTISSKLCNNHNRKYTNKSNTSSETSISISEEISDTTDINLYEFTNDNEIEKEMMYLILTQQKNEAIEQCKTLEILLSQNHKKFKTKCDEFKKQLKEYKNTNNYLQIENNKLKTDIQQLKSKLKKINTQNNKFDSLLWKRRKNIKNKYNQQQLPNFVRKDYKPKAKKQNKNSNNNNDNNNSSGSSAVTPLTHIRHLTTILEDNTVPLQQLLTLKINHSTENSNIDEQWMNNSIAEESSDENNENGNENEYEYENESITHSNTVSYMSNNTIILNELSNQLSNDLSNKLTKIHIGSISNTSMIEYDQLCDDKVESPIKLDSDYSFNVAQV